MHMYDLSAVCLFQPASEDHLGCEPVDHFANVVITPGWYYQSFSLSNESQYKLSYFYILME